MLKPNIWNAYPSFDSGFFLSYKILNITLTVQPFFIVCDILNISCYFYRCSFYLLKLANKIQLIVSAVKQWPSFSSTCLCIYNIYFAYKGTNTTDHLRILTQYSTAHLHRYPLSRGQQNHLNHLHRYTWLELYCYNISVDKK